jgi:hypothetical protein
MQPPTGGTILTAASTGTPSRPEGRPDAKLANILFTRELHGRYHAQAIRVVEAGPVIPVLSLPPAWPALAT